MVRRLCRTVALAVAGTLSLLNASLDQSGAALSALEDTAPAQTAAKNRKPLSKQAESRAGKQEEAKISEFVALGCLLLENACLADNVINNRISAFDPAVIDWLVSANPMVRVTGPVNRSNDGLPFKSLFSTLSTTSGIINIQPLAIGNVAPTPGNYIATRFPYPMVLWATNDSVPGETADFDSSSVFKTVSGFGEQQESGPSTTVKGGKSPFNYSYKKDKVSLNSGVSWINDLADSNGVSQAFQKAGFDGNTDKVPGVNVNLGASYQAFSLTGGYIRAFDRYAPNQPAFTGNESEPGAWTSEIAYTTELLRKETVLAVGYQKSSESMKLYLPEQRYITKASMAILDGTTLSLEYYRDKDYSVDDGGGNGDGYGVTTKIGFEFPAGR
jgi:hypothetical protein